MNAFAMYVGWAITGCAVLLGLLWLLNLAAFLRDTFVSIWVPIAFLLIVFGVAPAIGWLVWR
jgi:hypothetical protein